MLEEIRFQDRCTACRGEGKISTQERSPGPFLRLITGMETCLECGGTGDRNNKGPCALVNLPFPLDPTVPFKVAPAKVAKAGHVIPLRSVS